MGGAFAPAAGPGLVPGYDGPRHALVCRNRALAGSWWRLVAGPFERFGPWHTEYARFRRWRQAGGGARAGPGPARDRPASAAGRFHRRAGARGGRRGKNKDSPVGQALGRSRGGFIPKRQVSGSAQGRICALTLTWGHAGDCPQGPGLLVNQLRPCQSVLADRAYDASYVRAQIQQAGATAVMPSKKNRTVPLA